MLGAWGHTAPTNFKKEDTVPMNFEKDERTMHLHNQILNKAHSQIPNAP